MKLHNRLCLSQAAGMALAICGSQAFQHYKLQRLFAEIGDQNAREVKQRLSDNIESLQRSVEFRISQALANGDMDVFRKAAALQKQRQHQWHVLRLCERLLNGRRGLHRAVIKGLAGNCSVLS